MLRTFHKSISGMTGKIIRLGFVILIMVVNHTFGQRIEVLTEGTKASLRGLSVVDDETIWVSGSNGTVGRSLDGGISWQWSRVKRFESNDFRDIEAFGKTDAVIMAIGSPSYILRTHDGAQTWQVCFVDTSSAMFLDALEFWNEQSGSVIGDPVNNKFFIGRTFDGGRSWQRIPYQHLPVAEDGEACFAASGTNLRAMNKRESLFVSGGKRSSLFIRDKKILLPFEQGNESSGANSIAVKNNKIFIVVGGDYLNKDRRENNCFITKNGGKTWRSPRVAPFGYRSCIEYIFGKYWVACGLSGVDISQDDGMQWQNISAEAYHVVRKSKRGHSVFFAGQNGKVGKLIIGR